MILLSLFTGSCFIFSTVRRRKKVLLMMWRDTGKFITVSRDPSYPHTMAPHSHSPGYSETCFHNCTPQHHHLSARTNECFFFSSLRTNSRPLASTSDRRLNFERRIEERKRATHIEVEKKDHGRKMHRLIFMMMENQPATMCSSLSLLLQ